MDETNLTDANVRPTKKLLALFTHEVSILLFLGILVGLLFAKDYGLSWDEYYHETYARHTIEMYLGERVPGDTITDLRFYGPGFNVFWLLARNLLVKVLPAWHLAEVGHFIYWLAFLPAPLLIYGLSRRYVGRIASLAATLLFTSQPLIFGHAFINPKDTPFMTAFLGAVWLGLQAVDLSAGSEQWLPIYRIPQEAIRVLARLATSWKTSTIWTKVSLFLIWGTLFLTSVELLVTHRPLRWFFLLVQNAYAGQAFGPVQAMFNAVAQDAYKTPLSDYLDKARILYLWGRFALLIGGCGVLFYLTSLALRIRITMRWFSRTRALWVWILAAIALGLCSAIRVFGPFAGTLVVLYAFLRLKKKAWLPCLMYGTISALVVYAAWPTLWGSPLKSLAASIFRMSSYPYEGLIRYEGYLYHAGELPRQYVPKLILFQLTLPAIIMSSLGLITILIALTKKKQVTGDLPLLLIWLGLPLSIVVLFRTNIYSAFNHMMFVQPPLFIIGSIGFEKILSLSRRGIWVPLIIGVGMVPGLLGIIQLHPYEMTYYNELVGGVSGAAGRFGLNIWGTTYREAIEYINEVAPEGASVLVNSNEIHTMTPLARADLKVTTLPSTSIQFLSSSPTYLVDGGSFAESLQAETVYVVEREGITLTSVQFVP